MVDQKSDSLDEIVRVLNELRVEYSAAANSYRDKLYGVLQEAAQIRRDLAGKKSVPRGF